MIRNRTHSAEPPRRDIPAAPAAAASAADVNQLGIRILGLRSIPLERGARLSALLTCVSESRRMPRQFVPLLIGEIKTACATLPADQQRRALGALS